VYYFIINLNDNDIFKMFYFKNLHILDQKSQDLFEYVKYKKVQNDYL